MKPEQVKRARRVVATIKHLGLEKGLPWWLWRDMQKTAATVLPEEKLTAR